MKKYFFSQRVINEWNKLLNYCVNASSVNMFKNIFDKGGLHIDKKIVGLSISKWLPCPLAIWNLLKTQSVGNKKQCIEEQNETELLQSLASRTHFDSLSSSISQSVQ